MTPNGETYISIHALVKRATVGDTVKKGAKIDFNPRPRKEGDLSKGLFQSNLITISIHALVKRATTGAKIYNTPF